MPSERVIRFTHTFLFTLVLLASVVALGISGSLVGHYNSDGYPPFHTNAYRDRIRILHVAQLPPNPAILGKSLDFCSY